MTKVYKENGIWCGFIKYVMRRPKESFRYEITAKCGKKAFGEIHYMTDRDAGGALIIPDGWPPTSAFVAQSDTPGRKIFKPIDEPLRWKLEDFGFIMDDGRKFGFIYGKEPKHCIPEKNYSMYLSEGAALRLAADMKVDVTWFFEMMLERPEAYHEFKWFVHDSRVADRYNVRKPPLPEEEMMQFWAPRRAHLI